MKSEADLVAEALSGAQEAYGEILRRFERPVYSLIVRMVGDSATAEDLAQEVFLKAFRSLSSYDPARKLSSWLFKIAHNASIDHLRRHAPDTVSLEAEPEEEGRGWAAVLADTSAESPDGAALRRDLGRALEKAIGTLRPEYRGAVLMRYAQGLSYEEIVEATGLPLGTVKTNLHRARKQLAEVMAAAGWAPPG